MHKSLPNIRRNPNKIAMCVPAGMFGEGRENTQEKRCPITEDVTILKC